MFNVIEKNHYNYNTKIEANVSYIGGTKSCVP